MSGYPGQNYNGGYGAPPPQQYYNGYAVDLIPRQVMLMLLDNRSMEDTRHNRVATRIPINLPHHKDNMPTHRCVAETSTQIVADLTATSTAIRRIQWCAN